ncbi:hypothetical protein D7X94_09700 [Acutalibacter sp. 1XD8-33]|uniref:relaxase/mobilization nuclease domain-containing protein n=1 Tax=Acutalibacter sp. 1XD8-33 TaxID=2320081 RepID=UPI000EA0D36C|nr:relaxase/mobilization nuclease domain-containing protein [Acutalibacter sp. 1XD8-33]RKJ40127.1 hypothetical protein D7X94_09700 [Acutalibacter sp. 1XD8-33]
MAYDKIIAVRSRLDHCVDYVLNREKTDLAAVLGYIGNKDKNISEGTVLETALNCSLETAHQDMMAIKQRWGKPGGVLGYHIIHSFAPGEVTPRQAHTLGVEFARRVLGEKYEVVVSTHLDHAHLHCHILFNSVSFVDGRKYQNTFKDYFGDIRGTSNRVSRENGLSTIEPTGRGRQYAEWKAENSGKPTIRGQVRQDIDFALAHSFTYKSFWAELARMGYEVKRGPNVKHTAIKPPGGKRFIRLEGLGTEYTEESLQKRLTHGRTEGNSMQSSPLPKFHRKCRIKRLGRPHPRLHGFRALYFRYIYLLRGMRPSRKSRLYSVKKEVTKLNRYVRQFQLLRENRIDTEEQLVEHMDSLDSQITGLVSRCKELYRQKRRGGDVELDIHNINQLRPLRRDLRLCRQIQEDLPVIREQLPLCVDKPPEKKQEKIKQRKRGHELWM